MYYIDIAGIAQSVEQRTEIPCVTSSNLVPGKINHLSVILNLCTIDYKDAFMYYHDFGMTIRVDFEIMDSCSS